MWGAGYGGTAARTGSSTCARPDEVLSMVCEGRSLDAPDTMTWCCNQVDSPMMLAACRAALVTKQHITLSRQGRSACQALVAVRLVCQGRLLAVSAGPSMRSRDWGGRKCARSRQRPGSSAFSGVHASWACAKTALSGNATLQSTEAWTRLAEVLYGCVARAALLYVITSSRVLQSKTGRQTIFLTCTSL